MNDQRIAEASAVADIVKKAYEPRTIHVERGTSTEADLLLVPNGLTVVDTKSLLDKYLPAPERIVGEAKFTTLESFVAHVKRFADQSSALFADDDADSPSLLAVLDYHYTAPKFPEASPKDVGATSVARWGGHRSSYAFPVSDAWKAWTSATGKPKSQADFAAFLEERIVDVIDPLTALETSKKMAEALLCTFAPPSRLIDLARGLTVRVESIVANQQSLANGESVMRFETQHQDERGAPLQVPGAFIVEIPVFRGGAAYQLGARLRYRVREGKVVWHFDLYRAEETFQHAFREACEKAQQATQIDLFYGTPEA